jgi:hypothetical protein
MMWKGDSRKRERGSEPIQGLMGKMWAAFVAASPETTSRGGPIAQPSLANHAPGPLFHVLDVGAPRFAEAVSNVHLPFVSVLLESRRSFR